MSDEKPTLVILPSWNPNDPVFVKEECQRCGEDRQFKNGEVVYNQRLGLAYSVDDIVEVLNTMRSWEDKAKVLIEKYEKILLPIQNLCKDYNIPITDVAATLEEYIVRDNE